MSGFDVQVAIGRTLINKLLMAVEKSPHWVPPFSGSSDSAIGEKVSIYSEYEIRLLNPRVRPAREQDAGTIPNLSELGMWIDSAGHVRIIIKGPQNRPIVDYRCSVEGTLSIVARALFDDEGPVPQLAVSFREATVQHLEFTNGPDDTCLGPMIARIVEFVALEELRRRNTILPLSGVPSFTLNPLGRAAALSAKSHYYRTHAGDLALGIAASMTPGGQPDFRLDPRPLRSGPSGDLVLAISEHYVNRVVANAVASLNGQRWRYDDWDELRRRDTGTENFAVSWTARLRSATVRFENGAMVFIVRAGFNATDVVGRVWIRPSAADGKLRLAIEDVAVDVPGPTGIAVKVLTNAIYFLVREIVETLGQRELTVRLEEVARLGSGVIVTGALFGHGPADTTVSAQIADVRVIGDEVWVVYTADVRIP